MLPDRVHGRRHVPAAGPLPRIGVAPATSSDASSASTMTAAGGCSHDLNVLRAHGCSGARGQRTRAQGGGLRVRYSERFRPHSEGTSRLDCTDAAAHQRLGTQNQASRGAALGEPRARVWGLSWGQHPGNRQHTSVEVCLLRFGCSVA